MSAVLSDAAVPRATARRDVAVVLFGTGKVGGAFLQLLRTPAGANLRLVGAANSRHQQTQPSALAERRLRERLDAGGEARDDTALLRALHAHDAHDKVIIDATASAELATRHPEWLNHGCHVVTANKALAGGDLDGWHALQAACARGVRYGNSATGDGMMVLHRTLAGYARHPNFGGILMIGLGCEVNQLTLYGQKGAAAGKRHFNIQDSGGSRKSVERAMGVLEEIAEEVGNLKREPIPLSEIVVGLQCGGSDGMSGITANPALGAAVDILADVGGIGILSETTEIYGAEHLLASRAASSEIAEKLDGLIKWWEDHVAKHGASIDNNPSPGNKRGGLTTILEKSLGAVAKGGSTPLNGVFKYAEKVSGSGLVFMDTPGYDPVSATGQVAGGANVIVFTTGRGSCFGSHPTPSIKVATNTTLYNSMEEDMDVNCGVIASGDRTIAEMGREIFELIVETASGKKTKSELFGYGDNEFVPWHLGATL